MANDAIVLLKADHKDIRRLFRDFQGAGDKASKKKASLAKQIISALTAHTYIEDEVWYPEVRALIPDLEEHVLESYEEHHVADVLCMELAAMSPGSERFNATAHLLIETITHHLDAQEHAWIRRVRAALGQS